MGNHIHIIGLGLIGGSIAAGLKSGSFYVTGYDINEDRTQNALDRSLIQEDHPPNDLPADLDGLVMAVPVPIMEEIIREVKRSKYKPEFIMDVGSTKSWICSKMEESLNSEIEFIGSHPMAGSEQSGLEASDPILFENAICVITPPETKSDYLTTAKIIWEELGALVLEMSPKEHDRVVSYVSHLPHFTAGALLHAIREVPNFRELALPLAAGGFRDTTRIALGDPKLWKDIFKTNKEQILKTINSFQSVIREASEILEEGNWDEMVSWFKQARNLRDEIPEKTKGLTGSLFELRLLAPDRPGILAEITTILGEASINITDIEVLRVREGEMGTIRLGFRRKNEHDQAANLLEDQARGVELI